MSERPTHKKQSSFNPVAPRLDRQLSWKAPGKPLLGILCGDLGGTNTRLDLHIIRENVPLNDLHKALHCVGKEKPYFRHTYKNDKVDDADGFNALLHRFLEESNIPSLELVAGCLAVAGPVANDRVSFTNISWMIDGRSLEKEFLMPDCSMRLVNDFAANGYGVVTLDPADYEDISPHGRVESTPGAPVACVGAGTGLGETYATSTVRSRSDFYDAWPSEGGHVAFSPRTEEQCELLMHLSKKFRGMHGEPGRVSTERIVSGKGIVNVYEFMSLKYPDEVDKNLHEHILTHNEGAGKVANAAYDNRVCSRTMEVVMDAYGAEIGNAAVKWLPFGGLYIAGGIAIKNVDRVRGAETTFMKAYLDRGRVAPLLDKIPLRLVLVDDLGLRGAKYVALSILITKAEMTAKLEGKAPSLGAIAEDVMPARPIAVAPLAPAPLDAVVLATSLDKLGTTIITATAALTITLAVCAKMLSRNR